MVLTCIFWALFFLPGYAVARRLGMLPRDAGTLYTLALGYAGTLCLVSPVSLLGYLTGAPLLLFSAALGLLVFAALWLLIRERAFAELWRSAKSEPWCAVLLLLGLLWLQGRQGGWLDGDATFHIGRMRVLLEHGFTNRDIYLSEYHFQHVYHSNLLFPVYASAAQWTHQSYLTTWFWTEPWAKLMVAAGHYVLAYALLQQRFSAWLTALMVIIANAGETYTLYPNTLCVGFLLPMLLGVGLSVALGRDSGWRAIASMVGLDVVLAQIHALYAVYAALMLAPFLIGSMLPGLHSTLRAARARWLALSALVSLGLAVPFAWVSAHGFRSDTPIESAPGYEDVDVPATPAPGIASERPAVFEPPGLAAGGGHLEKVLDPLDDKHLVFSPGRMGGLPVVLAGFAALLLGLILGRGWRRALLAVALLAAALAALLFTPVGVKLALVVLRSPFVVARLSTVLSSLLMLGVCACIASLVRRVPRARSLVQTLATLVVALATTQLLGHAPLTFREHALAALAPYAVRHGVLDQLEVRRRMLATKLPRGATVIATARFARQVVMLRDCYVLAADRGHTAIVGIDKRRRDVVLLNAANTPWPQRAGLIAFYRLSYVVFEQRWQRRYRWAYEHGQLLGRAAGLDVVRLPPQ